MDIQRSLLIAALVLLSFMLLTEWVQFKDAHTQATPEASQTAAVPDAIPETGGESAIPEATSSELPAIGSTGNDKPVGTVGAADAKLTVKTDTLLLTIALTGGDITSVALPQHLRTLGKTDEPFQLLEQTATRTYVAQSGLIGANGTDTPEGRPRFRAAATHYEMAPGQNELVVDLLFDAPGNVSVTKRFRFQRGDYVVSVEYLIDNRGPAAWEAALFGQLKRDGGPDPGTDGGALGVKPFLGFATHTADEPYHKFTFGDIADTPYQGSTTGGWIALVQHYFISAWIPDPEQQNAYAMLVTSGGHNIGRFTTGVLRVAAGSSGSIGARFYAGPKDQYRLRQISPGLDLTVDYGWLWWIAQPLFALLHFFATGEMHIGDWVFSLGSGIGNWGWSIILLTVIIKLAFFHLSATSYKSMAKMRKLQPKMLELRERHGDDRQKLSQETMELYRKEKVNPLGGCLPILIQMPVFISLYWVLLESVELRHAPFMLWIHDLSVMDPYFVLPLLMGASMYIQQKLNPPPPDPMQAKIFQFMPIIFTVFFLFFPAGLVLYWLVNNILSIAQQWVITRQIEQAA